MSLPGHRGLITHPTAGSTPLACLRHLPRPRGPWERPGRAPRRCCRVGSAAGEPQLGESTPRIVSSKHLPSPEGRVHLLPQVCSLQTQGERQPREGWRPRECARVCGAHSGPPPHGEHAQRCKRFWAPVKRCNQALQAGTGV